MIRTLIVEDSFCNEKEIRVGWIYDSPAEKRHAQYLTHDINQDAEGIIDDLNAEGNNFTLIGEVCPQ